MSPYILLIGAGVLGAMMGLMLGAFVSAILYKISPSSWPKLITFMLGAFGGTSAAPIVAAALGKADTLGPYILGLGLFGIIGFVAFRRSNLKEGASGDMAAKATVAIVLELGGDRLDEVTKSKLLQVLMLTPEKFNKLREDAMGRLEQRVDGVVDEKKRKFG
jgi:hypothetical protein